MRAKEKESRSAILLTETLAQGQFQISARQKTGLKIAISSYTLYLVLDCFTFISC